MIFALACHKGSLIVDCLNEISSSLAFICACCCRVVAIEYILGLHAHDEDTMQCGKNFDYGDMSASAISPWGKSRCREMDPGDMDQDRS
ncbi:MAG: hypothetical protein BGP09_28120 [Rhizobium sp. 60-20]|nr:MAG: hypothetical protein BGP09_28120 [Rhizobium sp. 60-20]